MFLLHFSSHKFVKISKMKVLWKLLNTKTGFKFTMKSISKTAVEERVEFETLEKLRLFPTFHGIPCFLQYMDGPSMARKDMYRIDTKPEPQCIGNLHANHISCK